MRELAKKVSGPSLSAVISPYLRDLTGELNETSGFYVQVHDAVEAVASVTSNQALAYTMKVGERAPLYAVSSGKIALMKMPADWLDDYLRRVKFEVFTPKTIGSKRQLREELAAIRKAGFAYSHEEFTSGIIGIATSVEHGEHFFGSLNLAVPTARFTREREILFRRALKSFATSIGQVIASRA